MDYSFFFSSSIFASNLCFRYVIIRNNRRAITISYIIKLFKHRELNMQRIFCQTVPQDDYSLIFSSQLLRFSWKRLNMQIKFLKSLLLTINFFPHFFLFLHFFTVIFVIISYQVYTRYFVSLKNRDFKEIYIFFFKLQMMNNKYRRVLLWQLYLNILKKFLFLKKFLKQKR